MVPGRGKLVTHHGRPYAVVLAWEDYEPVSTLIDAYREHRPSELDLTDRELAAHAVTESVEPDSDADVAALRDALAE